MSVIYSYEGSPLYIPIPADLFKLLFKLRICIAIHAKIERMRNHKSASQGNLLPNCETVNGNNLLQIS